jgi:hypothetical protein
MKSELIFCEVVKKTFRNNSRLTNDVLTYCCCWSNLVKWRENVLSSLLGNSRGVWMICSQFSCHQQMRIGDNSPYDGNQVWVCGTMEGGKYTDFSPSHRSIELSNLPIHIIDGHFSLLLHTHTHMRNVRKFSLSFFSRPLRQFKSLVELVNVCECDQKFSIKLSCRKFMALMKLSYGIDYQSIYSKLVLSCQGDWSQHMRERFYLLVQLWELAWNIRQ